MVLGEDIEVELVEVGPERRMTNELIAAERKLGKKKKIDTAAELYRMIQRIEWEKGKPLHGVFKES